MQKTVMIAAMAAAVLVFTPAVPFFGTFDSNAAYANNGNGNGNSGGNGNGNAGGNGSSNAGGNGSSNAGGTGNSTTAGGKAANGAEASGLGKMNGAMNASINAVIAHIQNGQTTNGPVGLFAGLAAADAGAVVAASALADIQAEAAAYSALEAAAVAAGFASVQGYLEAKAAGTATAEQIAALDPLIDALGGTAEGGLALANPGPTAEEIADAEAAVAAALAAVSDAEGAIGDAMNKDGDLVSLLDALRARLVGYEDEVAAALAD